MPKKPITLTPRDKALLSDIREYGLHPTKRLAANHFPGVQHSTVLRRLRLLESASFIQKVPDLGGAGAAWGLTKAGAKLFPEASKVHFPRFIQEHDLKLAALRLRLEEVGLARAWRPEHEIRAKAVERWGRYSVPEISIPDGLMGVDAKGFREAVAIELELTAKNQQRYQKIFSDYFSKRQLWGFWYVVAKPTIGKQLVTAHKGFSSKSTKPCFFWSLLEEVMADPLRAHAHTLEGTFRVKDLWAAEVPVAAYSPAQGMSTLEGETTAPAHNLTSENNL